MRGGGRAFPIFVLATSAIVLATVLAAQYWGGLAPCELCLSERWPWDVAVVVAFVAAMVGNRPAVPWVALLLAAVFAVGSVLAFYHVGVEQHWFAGPSACTAAAGAPATLDALRAELMHQQPVRCDEPAWTLFGISLAGWNLLASLAMTGICVGVYARVRGRRRAGLAREVR
ncbi:MAG TPA: disulfide bond formation protein B [Stellaceae bacterium]|jgi:disulfide bond formation protein DsbB|nr:disulfide bond formation protein B [Stellaceae bacterium]